MIWENEFELFSSSGNHKSLIKMSEEIERKEFFLPSNYLSYIRSLSSLGLKEKADEVAIEAISVFPNDCSLRIRYAENAMSSHDFDNAALRWNYILSNFKNYPQGVFWRLANAYLRSFNFSKAREVANNISKTYGSSQKLNDLISLIDSSESKKYLVGIEKIPSNVRYHLDSTKHHKKNGRIEDFLKYTISGWVKVHNDEPCRLLVKNSKGEINSFELNKKRGDVVRFFESHGESDININCGFNYTFNISNGISLGFLKNGSEEWVSRFNISGILSVIEGKNGWLFLDNDSNKSVSQFVGEILLSKDMISEWENYAEDLYNYRKNNNLIYFIANSKETIVPNNYPYKRGAYNICSEVESILEKKGVEYLNPKKILSLEDCSYYKTDTHWSDYGGYLGYLSVMNKTGFFDVIKNIEFEDIEVAGDLGSKLNPVRKSFKKNHRYNGPIAKCIFSNGLSGSGAIEVWENPNATYSKTVVLFGGSSLRSGSFAKYFCYSFCRVVIVNLPGSLVDDIVRYESPDIIVIQTNERYLSKPGKIYENCETSPISGKYSSFLMAEKKQMLAKIENNYNEIFYIDKTIELLGFS